MERLKPLQCGPRAAGRCGWRDSGEAGGRGRPEAGGGWPGGLLGSAGRLGRGGGRAGEGARRRPVAAAATARESRRGEARPAKGGRWEFQGGLGEVVEVPAKGGRWEFQGGLRGGARHGGANSGAARCAHAGGSKRHLFIGRARTRGSMPSPRRVPRFNAMYDGEPR
jgi:hypothetical protein